MARFLTMQRVPATIAESVASWRDTLSLSVHTLAHLEVGSVFASDFRVLRRLSQGGMGTVYVVEQLSTGKQRALKLMLPQLVSDASLRKRFEQEARVGARIESEHIVDVVGAGVDAATGTPWLAMEFLQGEDLATRVQRAGALPPDELQTVLGQVCHAIAAAHDAGVVHRDLKPENIFLAQARRAEVKTTVKVLDFGIAKLVADARTTATAAIGSPSWMAPEQTARGAVIGPTTDIWALGLIAFYLLTGRHYFRAAEDEASTLANLLREVVLDPLPLASERARELHTTLPAGFDSWFLRAVDRDPAARFASVREMQHAFEQLFNGATNARTQSFDAPAATPNPHDPPIGPGSTVLTDSSPIAHAVPPIAQRAVSTTIGLEATPVSPRRTSRAPVLAIGALLLLGGSALALTRPWRASTPAPASSSPAIPTNASPAATLVASPSASNRIAEAPNSPLANNDVQVTPVAPSKHSVGPAQSPTPNPSQPRTPTEPQPTRPTTPSPIHQPPELPPSPVLPSQPTRPTSPTPDPTSPIPPTPTAPTPTEPSPTQPSLPDMPDSPFRRRGQQGFLNVNTSPPSDVYLDGRLLGATPLQRVAASPGSHALRFVVPGEGINRTISVTVSPGETREIFRRLRVNERRFRD